MVNLLNRNKTELYPGLPAGKRWDNAKQVDGKLSLEMEAVNTIPSSCDLRAAMSVGDHPEGLLWNLGGTYDPKWLFSKNTTQPGWCEIGPEFPDYTQ